jgi:hypothetical protein
MLWLSNQNSQVRVPYTGHRVVKPICRDSYMGHWSVLNNNKWIRSLLWPSTMNDVPPCFPLAIQWREWFDIKRLSMSMVTAPNIFNLWSFNLNITKKTSLAGLLRQIDKITSQQLIFLMKSKRLLFRYLKSFKARVLYEEIYIMHQYNFLDVKVVVCMSACASTGMCASVYAKR